MLKVGLTGGIGSGKSTAVSRFQALGAHIVDADKIARAVVAPGQPALQEIAAVFGPEAIDASGALDRAWLRKQVFDDPAARLKLEAITNPAIRQRLTHAVQQTFAAPYLIVDIPLLVEKDYQPLFDAIVVVDCEPEQQLQRALLRDGSDEGLIKGIMKAQASRARRLESATHILDNSSTLADLYQQVDQLHETFIQLAVA